MFGSRRHHAERSETFLSVHEVAEVTVCLENTVNGIHPSVFKVGDQCENFQDSDITLGVPGEAENLSAVFGCCLTSGRVVRVRRLSVWQDVATGLCVS